jgi:hypothetical protein
VMLISKCIAVGYQEKGPGAHINFFDSVLENIIYLERLP